jgi:hypothetical protein
MNRIPANIFAHLALTLAIPTAIGLAQEMELPVNVQWALLPKILAFDRNLTSRASDTLTVGVLFQERFRKSLDVKEEFIRAVGDSPELIAGSLAIRCIPLDIGENPDWEGLVLQNRPDILYITPLRAVDLTAVTRVTRKYDILTMTGVPEYVEGGVSVGIGLRGGNPEIVINREAAAAEGADFSSKLLKLARVIP